MFSYKKKFKNVVNFVVLCTQRNWWCRVTQRNWDISDREKEKRKKRNNKRDTKRKKREESSQYRENLED